jgi:2-oxoglutarate ferredoxin oxidoreductase subunit delta
MNKNENTATNPLSRPDSTTTAKAVKEPPATEENVTDVPKGQLILVKKRCKSCGFCVEFCPKKVLAISDEYNKKGYRLPMAKNPQDCIGCNFCSIYCPDLAIYFKKKTDKPQ